MQDGILLGAGTGDALHVQPALVWSAFAIKATERYFLKRLLWWGVKMLNPRFFMELMRPIPLLLSEKGMYGQD